MRELFWTVDITSATVIMDAAERLQERVVELTLEDSAAPPLFL
jgi:hypothetical protein